MFQNSRRAVTGLACGVAAGLCATAALLFAVPTAADAAGPASAMLPAADAVAAWPAASSATLPPVATPTTYRLEEDRSVLRFSGMWKYRNRAASSGLSERYSRLKSSSASIGFDGTGVTVIGQLGPNHGKARIYLDGVATRTVSLYAPVHADQQPIVSLSGLPKAKHKLTVVVLGTKESSSTGTYVHLDAFDIEGGGPVSLGDMPGKRVQNGDPRLYRKGTWSKTTTQTAYGGSLMRTTTKGAAMTLRFKGTAVAWFGRKGLKGGLAEVWLDGNKVATVSQFTTAPVTHRRVVWAASGLKDKTHDLVVKSLGQPSVPGGGTRTDVDMFQVRGTVGTALRPTPFKYPWQTYIVIDKSDYKLYWVKNKMLVKTYPIAHGKNNCTPERVWRIDAKYPHTGGVYGPRKMRMFKRVSTASGYRYVFSAYAIHGTNQEWVIGTQASHGCIRMYNKDVVELYPQVPYGTMVVTRK